MGSREPEGNLEVMDVFITLTVVVVSQRYTNVKTHQTVHFKHTQLTVPIKLLKEVKAKLFSHLNDELILSSFPWRSVGMMEHSLMLSLPHRQFPPLLGG